MLHSLHRLVAYHFQCNPIEMAWGFLKDFYSKHIRLRSSSNVKVANLWRETFQVKKLISDVWARCMVTFSVTKIPVIILLAELDNDIDLDISSELIEVEKGIFRFVFKNISKSKLTIIIK